MADNETHYNAIVGVIDGELAILEYTFEDGENFKGGVGYRMRTMTQEYIDCRKDPDNADEDLWKQAVAGDYTTLGLDDWWEDACDEAEMEGKYYPFDDDSFRYETNELYEALSDDDREKIEEIMGVKGEDYVDFECGSGGRCFDANAEWDLILRPDLVELINKLEG